MNDLAAPKYSKLYIYFLAYSALVFISVAASASYFAYDCIGPLIPQLKAELGFTDYQAYWLYSIYSIPVILFVVFGGMLADKLGVKKSAILFTAAFTFGTILTATENFTIMLIGRFLFGIGAEAYYVIMNKILAKWFKGRGLAMAFGVNLFLCRGGTWAALNGLPWMADNLSLSTTLWIVAGINIFGLAITFLYALLDNIGEKKKIVTISEEGEDETFKIKEAVKLPLAFWVISLLCMTYYSAIFPFQGAATDFFIERYGYNNIHAGRIASILVTISMFTTWIFGAIIDRIGKRATMLIIGSLAMIPTHISMAYTDINPWIPMVVLGMSFSLVPAALWPALPLMVKEQHLGTAYGIIAMVQNIGLFAFPLAVASIHTRFNSYNPAMIMFAGLSFLGFIFAIWLKIIESKGGHYLEKV
ncbi:MFS transporter [candidate division KSB1 bacterium 4572_119]|nr:MAG: MFS transporter [candidate division KSB1 bacterium 4572_119]